MPALPSPIGYDSTDNIYLGDWSYVVAIVDPLGAATRLSLGAVTEGVARSGREDATILNTTFPRTTAAIFTVSASMQFVGQGMELRPRLAHFLVGDERLDSSSQYVYPGGSCASDSIDVGFEAQRINCAQDIIVFHLWKARCSGVFEVPSGDNAVSTPLEINALSDTQGDFGGSNAHPYGYFYFTSLGV